MSEIRFFASYGLDGTLVYDLEGMCIVREISDYSLHLRSRQQISALTERLRIEHLVAFWRYLAEKKVSLHDLTDRKLEAYRDILLKSTLSNPRSIGSQLVAKGTVNAKLVSIYQWLCWLQTMEILRPGSVGAYKCRITVHVEHLKIRRRQRRQGLKVYPLLFPRTGAGSKHRASLALTREQLDATAGQLVDRDNHYTGLRDSLALDIAAETSMRRVSINSLTIDLFDREKLEAETSLTFDLRPIKQKFSYEEDIRFPVQLGLRVLDFIEGARERLLESKPHLKNNAKNSIFLSATTCKPLTNRALTQSIASAMRASGLPKGVSLHSGRRLFAAERIEQELESRLALGLDTSTASICAAVSMEMSQRHPDSLFPYVTRAQSRRALEASAKRDKKV